MTLLTCAHERLWLRFAPQPWGVTTVHAQDPARSLQEASRSLPKPPAGSRGGLLWGRCLSFSGKWSERRFHNVFLPGAAMLHGKTNKQMKSNWLREETVAMTPHSWLSRTKWSKLTNGLSRLDFLSHRGSWACKWWASYLFHKHYPPCLLGRFRD